MIVTTWNLQGSNATTEVKWQTGVANLFRGSLVPPDAICLQEAGGVPASAMHRVNVPIAGPGGNMTNISVWDWGGTTRNSMRTPAKTIIFHNWDTGGNRVNTAVVTRTTLPHPAQVALVWGTNGPVWRPAVGVLFRGEWLFSYHAISPGGADAPNVLARVAALAGGSSWRVGGDFNRAPATLGGAGVLPANSVVCPPNQPTHPCTHAVSQYDYFVCEGNAARTGLVDTSLFLSDHWSVDFAF